MRSGRDEKIAAVAAAPVAAEMPAMMARVVFDIVIIRSPKVLKKRRASSTYETLITQYKQSSRPFPGRVTRVMEGATCQAA